MRRIGTATAVVSRKTGRRVRLGPPLAENFDTYAVGRFRVAGDVVAFALTRGRVDRRRGQRRRHR